MNTFRLLLSSWMTLYLVCSHICVLQMVNFPTVPKLLHFAYLPQFEKYIKYCAVIIIIFTPLQWKWRVGEKRQWDPARIRTWVFWILVRCSYQLSHWSSGIGAEDRWYLSIDAFRISGWISQSVGFTLHWWVPKYFITNGKFMVNLWST